MTREKRKQIKKDKDFTEILKFMQSLIADHYDGLLTICDEQDYQKLQAEKEKKENAILKMYNAAKQKSHILSY